VPQSIPFDQTPGPTNPLHSTNPLDYLEIFLNNEVIDLLVTGTRMNCNAKV
jgi:hypothetical protein